MIEIKKLTKKYSGKTVLKDIDFAFDKGHIYGIMGENGAGKSTLFRCVMKMEHYEGEVNIPESTSIGYLDDTPYFYPFVTGQEYLEFCLKAREITITKEMIPQLNKQLLLPLKRYASNYSLGMKKRLVLMALMLENNDLTIMDEPFNGLDLAGTIILKQWIRKMKEQDKTIVLSSHIISSLTDICDNITYIHGGLLAGHYSGMTAAEIEEDITHHYLSYIKV